MSEGEEIHTRQGELTAALYPRHAPSIIIVSLTALWAVRDTSHYSCCCNIQGTFSMSQGGRPWAPFMGHSGNIQGHSGNIQGPFREHLGDIQGTFREHLGNIDSRNMQWTVTEHSVGIEWTLSEHQWTLGEHVEWTFSEHSVNIEWTRNIQWTLSIHNASSILCVSKEF